MYLLSQRLYEEIESSHYQKKSFTADCAEPKSIDELRGYGLRVEKSQKGKDSITHGIQYIQDFERILQQRVCSGLAPDSLFIAFP